MACSPPPRTGVFVVSAWVEVDGTPRMRARIRFTTDVESAAETVRAADSVDDVVAELRRWWESLNRTG